MKKKKTDEEMLEELTSAPICINCEHCIYIGEGDSICDVNGPRLILADWEPTDDYWYCAGTDYEGEEE